MRSTSFLKWHSTVDHDGINKRKNHFLHTRSVCFCTCIISAFKFKLSYNLKVYFSHVINRNTFIHIMRSSLPHAEVLWRKIWDQNSLDFPSSIWGIYFKESNFRFVTKQFCLFGYRFETPEQTETNQNFLFLVSQNKPKQTRNRSCFGLFQLEPKFILPCFEDTLGSSKLKYT